MDLAFYVKDLEAKCLKFSKVVVENHNGLSYVVGQGAEVPFYYNGFSSGEAALSRLLEIGNLMDESGFFDKRSGKLPMIQSFHGEIHFDENGYFKNNGLVEKKALILEKICDFVADFGFLELNDLDRFCIIGPDKEIREKFSFPNYSKAICEPIIVILEYISKLYQSNTLRSNEPIDFNFDLRFVAQGNSLKFYTSSLEELVNLTYCRVRTNKTSSLIKCPNCGNWFVRDNTKQKFCSDNCRKYFAVKKFRLKSKREGAKNVKHHEEG